MFLMLLSAGCGLLAGSDHGKASRTAVAIKELRRLRLETNDELARPSILACGNDSLYATWVWRPGGDRKRRGAVARDTLFIGLTRDGSKWDRKAVLAVGKDEEARLVRSSRGVYVLLGSPMRLLRIHDDLSTSVVADLDYPAMGAALAVDAAFKEPDSLAAVYNIVTQAPGGGAMESILFARWNGAMRPSNYEMVSQVRYSANVAPTAALSYVDGLPRIIVNQAVGPCLAGVTAPNDGRPVGLPAVVEYRRGADGPWQARTLSRGVPEFWTMASAVPGSETAVLLQSEDRLACLTRRKDGSRGLASLRAPTSVALSPNALFGPAALVSDSDGGPFAIATWRGMQDWNKLSLTRPRLPNLLAILLEVEPTEDVFFTGIDLNTAVAGDVRSVGDASPWQLRESASGMALASAPRGGALAVVTEEPRGNRMRWRLRVYRLLRRE